MYVSILGTAAAFFFALAPVSFAQAALTAPAPLSPINQQVVTMKPVTTKWSTVNRATSYRLSVVKATDTEFANPVIDKIVSTNSGSFSLPDGNYMWIVRARRSSTSSPWSSRSAFTLRTVTNPSPSPTQTPTPAPAGAAPRGMWSWYDSEIATTSNQTMLLDFAVINKVNVIYVHAQSLLQNNPQKLAEFINAAAARNIKVELLFGFAEWALTANHQGALDQVARVNSFVSSLSGAKPVGVHFDIEPHALPAWSTDPVGLGHQLIDLYGKMRPALNANLYLNIDIAMGYRWVSITRNGVTKSLSHWLVDVTDRTTIMSYRDYALGVDSITEHSSHPIAYAASKGKVTVVGVETECLQDPPKVSFCEEGKAFMENELAKVGSFFKDHVGYGGHAIHHYRPYSVIKP